MPVLIEPVDPPLGFRQYQTISLVNWNGRGQPSSMPRILSAIAALGTPHVEAVPASPAPQTRVTLPRRAALFVGIPLAIAGTAALLWFHSTESAAPPSVLVAASNSGSRQQSSALAHEVVLDLGRIQQGPLNRISIRESGQAAAGDADYRIEVGQRDGADGHLLGDATLLDAHHQVLWTTNVDVEAARLSDLHQQLAAQIGSVLACSARVPSMQPRPTGELLKLYLTGCASLYGSLGQPEDETYNIFNQIAVEQPKLADGWAGLAVLEAAVGPVDPDYARIRQLAIEHLKRAKQLNPHLELVYAAETRLQSVDTNYGAAIDALQQGVVEYPDSALLYYDLAAAYQRVGRIRESVDSAHNAFLLDPLSAGAISSYVYALAFAGNLQEAQDQLQQAERIWPGSQPLETYRYYFSLRFGDAANAGQVAKENSQFIHPTAAEQAFIAARLSPTKSNENRAIAAYEAAYRSNPSEILNLLQALGTFGRVDDALRLMDTVPNAYLVGNSDTLFRSNMRSVRHDVRFIAEAHRLGLTKVWKQTGHWPDFCGDPDLPYDCKKEAAKFTD